MTRSSHPRFGLSNDFHSQELFPLVEREYRGSTVDRSLFGFSSGALFAIAAALTRPGMFRRAIAACCTWPRADEYLLRCQRQCAEQPEHLPMDLYLSVGGLEEEQLPGYRAVAAALRTMEYPGFRLVTEILDGEKHGSGVLARSFVNGLRAVFRP